MKIGINGFGRIGRCVLRIIMEGSFNDIEVVAINARANSETLRHLFMYDSCFGTFRGTVDYSDDELIINGKKIAILRQPTPKDIPWSNVGVDIVIDSTGKFKTNEDLQGHIDNGAKKVVLTAPGKNVDATIVMGVNENDLDLSKHNIISNASCTTNCLAPVAKVLNDKFGIKKGMITTVHSYTGDQPMLDKTHKDLRRARAGAVSIVPTTTGAAKAVGLVIPELNGKLNGFALRVPTPTVSVTDLVCELNCKVTAEEVNNAFKEAANNSMKGILGICDEPLVSIDYKGDSRSSIVDGLSTMVMEGDMLKVVSWYDNEWGYSARVVDLVQYIINGIK
ncbi:glyceraldehyde 3-phosphate dehydrogenase [Hathewaya proteolytica DSM 3090]|uniref:Glyceraldehyde-3-phosphate dehydrogenase n=1 Tax=Hathewaya proteolytica DSM 3090 TaxID=1121331 RepID=A0A1M6NSA9_9CLOT|nr:type I glyceraldehyde-3-phosphate dehydrogenase [Hathewaya proteolytica]SHJ98583.1 glyceraldehyde 3-phosphate dehydrogenase [Hathewaya proteolytica DSM 3090]